MNIVQYFRQGADFWIAKINTEGRLTDEEVKLASEFCYNAFKWDCDSQGERVAKELQNKGYAKFMTAEERKFQDSVFDLLYNDIFHICVNYIRTYSPELYDEGNDFIVKYTDDKGNDFKRSVRKLDNVTFDEEYYKSKFKEIQEEARVWLIKQNEVLK